MEMIGQSVVNPMVRFLTEIIDDINRGDLRVPNFQRPYVWKPSDVIALFDSIYNGYPIGSLLFWETTEDLDSFTKIGPFSILLSDRLEKNYIIDGHQRLSTLYGILRSKDKLEEIDSVGWNLYFDLDRNEFYFKTQTSRVLNFIAMDKLINTIDFLEECKRIQHSNPSNSDVYIMKAQRLAQAIITYKISITQIKKGNLTSAVEIFSRLNTRGMDMTPDQMLSALTYKDGTEGFKLSDKIDSILTELIEFNFSEIDRIFVFRSIIAAAKRDIYNVKLEDLAKDKRIDLPSIVEACQVAIVRAVQFLVNTLNVPGDNFLPYNLQFVFLSEFFFREPNPNDDQVRELIKWFWYTSYSGWFAGANSSKVRKGLDDIRLFASKEAKAPLSATEYEIGTVDIPDKFDFRFARIKSFILFLNSLDPQPLEDTMDAIDLRNSLRDFGLKALHQVTHDEPNAFSNRMILGPMRSAYARLILMSPSITIDPRILASHAITPLALQALRSGNTARFLKLREQELLSLEERFIQSFGLIYKSTSFKPTLKGQYNLFGNFEE